MSDETASSATSDLCDYFQGQDMHGGHFIVTKDFNNVHVSNVEFTKMGQASLGRYPLHWHMAGDVGPETYQDPSSFENNSIHHCFNHFVTVHCTHNALVKDNVGYITRGHGYFIEDGYEKGTQFIGNLGMVIHEGPVLPTEKGEELCNLAKEGYEGYVDTDACQAFSMFWISNINTYLKGNYAIGGRSGYWMLAHNGDLRDFVGVSRVYPPAPWENNTASACRIGVMQDLGIEDRQPGHDPKQGIRKIPHLGKLGGLWQTACYNDNCLTGCAEIVFDGWNIHHTISRAVWMRQSTVIWKNGQFSDNKDGVTFATTRCGGSYQTLQDSTFVGFTNNIGPTNGAEDHINYRGQIQWGHTVLGI